MKYSIILKDKTQLMNITGSKKVQFYPLWADKVKKTNTFCSLLAFSQQKWAK